MRPKWRQAATRRAAADGEATTTGFVVTHIAAVPITTTPVHTTAPATAKPPKPEPAKPTQPHAKRRRSIPVEESPTFQTAWRSGDGDVHEAMQPQNARILVLHQAAGREFDEVNWVGGDFAAVSGELNDNETVNFNKA
jgi:hypothetical protein